jgi:hypothetical protein
MYISTVISARRKRKFFFSLNYFLTLWGCSAELFFADTLSSVFYSQHFSELLHIGRRKFLLRPVTHCLIAARVRRHRLKRVFARQRVATAASRLIIAGYIADESNTFLRNVD